MKNFNLLKNTYLKIIYIECYNYAIINNGVVNKHYLKDLILTEEYKKLFEVFFKESFSEKEIFNKLFFLKEIKKTDIKNLNKNFFSLNLGMSNVGDYLFEDALEKIEEEKIFNVFKLNGIDPVSFLKSALLNTKKRILNNRKNTESYFFEDLFDISNNLKKDIEEMEEKKNKQTIKTNDDYCIEHQQVFINDDVLGIEINCDTEKVLNKNKIKEKITLIDKVEVKNTWSYLLKALENEGKTTKQANTIIGKAIKDNGTFNVIKALNKIKNRKTTPINIMSAIYYLIEQEKEKEEKNNVEEQLLAIHFI